MIELPYLSPDTPFPDVASALSDPDGLLAYGADLSIKRLFHAYSQGIFPWFSDDEPILWWSPGTRAIIELKDFHYSKSLKKLIKQQRYRVSLNTAFSEVIRHCADIPRHYNGTTSNATWITTDMQQAYINLHKAGIAHSIEVWDNTELVGGLYGVGIGKIFCGESMFHHQPNTSKLAMANLVTHMQRHHMAFIDCQLPTPHLKSLGAIALPRSTFITKLIENRAMLLSSGELAPEYKAAWLAQEAL
jgi:leucyl/phenylalanyl-tRNA--protein transferase